MKLNKLFKRKDPGAAGRKVQICCMQDRRVEGVIVPGSAKRGFTPVRVADAIQVVDWEAEPQVIALIDKDQVVNIDDRNLIYVE